LKPLLAAALIGAVLLYGASLFIAEDATGNGMSNTGVLGTGALVGAGVQIGVRLLGVS
jgi:hypothetical protein